MSTLQSLNNQNKKGVEQMGNDNSKLERIWSGIGWGLALILIGVLIFGDNQGWLRNGTGWLYFAIGLGMIFIVGFLVQCLRNIRNFTSSLGGLVAGLSLVYIGAAFLYGFGNWWPMVFIPIGVGYVVKAIWHGKSSYIP
jgi:hypothetical protein